MDDQEHIYPDGLADNGDLHLQNSPHSQDETAKLDPPQGFPRGPDDLEAQENSSLPPNVNMEAKGIQRLHNIVDLAIEALNNVDCAVAVQASNNSNCTTAKTSREGSMDMGQEGGDEFLTESYMKEADNAGRKLFSGNDNRGLLYKCIANIPESWDTNLFLRFLNERKITFATGKKTKQIGMGIVGFESEEHIMRAKEKLDGKHVNTKILKVVDVLPRAWEKKVFPGSVKQPRQPKKNRKIANNYRTAKSDPRANPFVTVKYPKTKAAEETSDVMTPFAEMPYEEQVKKKSALVTRTLKKLVVNVHKALLPGVPSLPWTTKLKFKGGLPCDFHGVLASPIIDRYRNTCVFGIASSFSKRVVGFQLGTSKEGHAVIKDPRRCRDVSLIARSYATAFQDFVQLSELPVWDTLNNTGFWQLLTVREGRARNAMNSSAHEESVIAEVMLIVTVCTAGVEGDVRTSEYSKMAQAFAIAASSACPCLPLTALLVKEDIPGRTNAAARSAPPLCISIPEVVQGSVVKGEDKALANYIHDHICNLRFRLSANSCFEVNTLASENLYTLVRDWARVSCGTLVLDLYSGAGAAALILASQAGMVVGIDPNPSNVEDARTNAEINNITNCQFVCGKPAHVMEGLLEQHTVSEKDQTITESAHNGNHLSGEKPGILVPSGSHSEVVEQTETETMQTSTDKLEQHCVCDQDVLKRTFTDVVVILEPTALGVERSVLRILRKYEQICRLVYVACDPEAFLANAVELCAPALSFRSKLKRIKGLGVKRLRGVRRRLRTMPVSEPFYPLKAVGVDLFPHTQHCEIVVVMEREAG